jgi:hypothetical protein
MEVHSQKTRGIPLFLCAAPDDDRRSDRQMSALRVRIRLRRFLSGHGGELSS